MEREIAQWVHPMKDRSDDPSHHERTLLPRSYISLHDSEKVNSVERLFYSGEVLEIVDKFSYLGVMLCSKMKLYLNTETMLCLFDCYVY